MVCVQGGVGMGLGMRMREREVQGTGYKGVQEWLKKRLPVVGNAVERECLPSTNWRTVGGGQKWLAGLIVSPKGVGG